MYIFNVASLRKSERLISSRGHGCVTISPPQLPAAATRFPSHGSGRPGLELRTATKLSSAGFEPTAVLTFGLRVRRLNHSATRSLAVLEPKDLLLLIEESVKAIARRRISKAPQHAQKEIKQPLKAVCPYK